MGWDSTTLWVEQTERRQWLGLAKKTGFKHLQSYGAEEEQEPDLGDTGRLR